MNKVILIGRLVADPEIRYTQSGKKQTSSTALRGARPGNLPGTIFAKAQRLPLKEEFRPAAMKKTA